MSEEAGALRAAWMSEADAGATHARTAVDRIIAKDEADRARERRVRAAGAVAMLLLVPFLVWAAAYGVTPLVRVAYALMAVGTAASLVAEWLFLEWSRRALPGPVDTRSQLQRTTFLVDCQGRLAKSAAVWTSPIFAGVLLICVWLYRERSAAEALTLGALDVMAWIALAVLALRMAATLARRRGQLEQVFADLEEGGQG